jgi:electron transfer flavoprotein beta subunit
MKIIVCIKQVPDTADIKIDPKTNTLIREGVASVLNSFDLWAIEEAVRIKEKMGGKVTALTMGPPQAEAILRQAISLGADEGILLSDPEFAGADTLATSYTLSQAIRRIGKFDLILCGKQAVDGDTAQVGPGIAAHLDIPQIIFVQKIREITNRSILAERKVEHGFEVISSSLPCMVSVIRDINRPRVPTLRGKMLARKAEILVWNSKDFEADPSKLGLKGSPTWVDRIFSPPQREGSKVIRGKPLDLVENFIHIAQNEKWFQ